MASNSGDKGTRNLVIAMVVFIVAVGVIFHLSVVDLTPPQQFQRLFQNLMDTA